MLRNGQRQKQVLPVPNRQGFHHPLPALPGAVQGKSRRIEPGRPATGITQIPVDQVQYRCVQFKQRRQPCFIRALLAQQPFRLRIGQHLATFIKQGQFGTGQKPAGGQHCGNLAQGQISANYRRPGRGPTSDGRADFAAGVNQVGIGLHPICPLPRQPVPRPAAGFKAIIRLGIAAQQIQVFVVEQKGPHCRAGPVAFHALHQIAGRFRGIERYPQRRICRQRAQQEKIAVVIANEQCSDLIGLFQGFSQIVEAVQPLIQRTSQRQLLPRQQINGNGDRGIKIVEVLAGLLGNPLKALGSDLEHQSGSFGVIVPDHRAAEQQDQGHEQGGDMNSQRQLAVEVQDGERDNGSHGNSSARHRMQNHGSDYRPRSGPVSGTDSGQVC